VFLRRRERAKSEFRRRNIFELYIEEVVEACARLKGGKLAKDKLKGQLQKIAAKRTGGARTDEILGRDTGPEGLPHSIIVTPDGPEGEAPVLPSPVVAPSEPLAAEVDAPAEQHAKKRRKGKAEPRTSGKRTPAAKHGPAGKHVPAAKHPPAAKHKRAAKPAKGKRR
jgi:DNA topoisomerase-6 subunit B